jgi:polyhydroxyalkanoate synthesis regulator phasin
MKTCTAILLVLAIGVLAVWATGDEPNAPAKEGGSGADVRRGGPGGSPRGRHGRGGRRGRRQHKALTEEQEAEFLEVIKKKRPFAYRMLMRLKEHNPDRYRGVLYRHWLDWQQLQRMPEKVRKAHETIQQGRRAMVKLIMQYRSAETDDAREKITSQIRTLAAEIFDAHLVMREYKVTELENRIKELRKELKELRRNRDDEIEKNVRKLLRRHGRGKDRRKDKAE